MTSEVFHVLDGTTVELNNSVWRVTYANNMSQSINTSSFDWRIFDFIDIEVAMDLGRLIAQTIGGKMLQQYLWGLIHPDRFLEDNARPNVNFPAFTETDGGAYEEWLKQQLSLKTGEALSMHTRTVYLLSIKRGLEEAFKLGTVIINECSVVELRLRNCIAKAIGNETRLISVGDDAQPPSAGPGEFSTSCLRTQTSL